MFENKYGELIGFFLGDFQYLENDQALVSFFEKEDEESIQLLLNELKALIHDSQLNWQDFCNEANIYFESQSDFLTVINRLITILEFSE